MSAGSGPSTQMNTRSASSDSSSPGSFVTMLVSGGDIIVCVM